MRKTPISIALTALLSMGINTALWAETPATTQAAPVIEQDLQAIEADLQSIEKEAQTQLNALRPPAEKATNEKPSAMPEQAAAAAPALTTTAINPADYEGKDLINSKGEKIGQVDKLVKRTMDQQTYAVVKTGGFMGVGNKEVVIAVDQLQPQDEQLLLSTDLTEEQLGTNMKYQEAEFSAFELRDELDQE